MNEDEDCDDLPSIIVNTSANISSKFTMPSAEQLAEQRARELDCELQLEQLRQRARDDERRAAARSHGDSSGSEGEQSLAATVTALSERADRSRGPAGCAPPAAELWAALTPHLPPPADELQAKLKAARPGATAVLARAVDALAGALVAEPGEWPPDELLCAGALLSVALLAQESRCRRTATRAFHQLLDDQASIDQVSALTAVLLAALPQARARLQLSDALCSGGGKGADYAAIELTGAALLQLLRAPPAHPDPASLEGVVRAACAWRSCAAPQRYVCVQLAGRLLAATTNDATPAQRERLLAHLSLTPTAPGDALTDKLKVSVGVSKLKLLFCPKNDVSRQARSRRHASTDGPARES